jgi:4-hydroxy-tetrahydrodipicolinate synthase
MKKPVTLKPVRTALTGPIASIRTPFNRDGSVDYDGVRRMIDFNIKSGGTVSLLTAGDSHFLCLTDEEVAELNKVVVEHTAGRVLTVACDWEYATPQGVKFAKYCASLGADLLMARPPDWASSSTSESLVEHYATLAEEIPLMFVNNIFGTRPEKFALDTTRLLLERVPNMIAMKEDITGDIARKFCMLVHDKWAVFAGGGLRNHLNIHPYGCDGFMDRHMNFAPQVSHQYWKAIQANDLPGALKVAKEIEMPLDDFMCAFPGGRDAAVHGLFEIYGLSGRWRRKPYHSLTDAELAKLKDFVKKMGLL